MFGNSANTGIRITRDESTNAPSNSIMLDGSYEESPTYNSTPVLTAQEFIEPVEGQTKETMLTQFGLEDGDYYMLFLPSNTANINQFDIVEFNQSGLYQNTDFDAGTTDLVRLTIKRIMPGAFSAGRLECLCKKE